MAVVSPFLKMSFTKLFCQILGVILSLLAAEKIVRRITTMFSGRCLKHSAVRPSGPPFLFDCNFRIAFWSISRLMGVNC